MVFPVFLRQLSFLKFFFNSELSALDSKPESSEIETDFFSNQNLTIMSDVFMRNVFKQWECTEYVLQVSGLMDMNTLNAGQDFSGLPESYVIFITRD